MDWHARVRDGFAGAPTTPDPDVVEELAAHLAALYHSALAAGCTAAEANRRLDEQLALWRREARDLRRPPVRAPAVEPPAAPSSHPLVWLPGDVRYAARLLRRQPYFAVAVITTMALGVAISSVLFSVTWSVLFRPLPWPHADRVVVVKETRGGLAPRFLSFTNAAYLAWRDEPRTIDELAAWSTQLMTLTGTGEPERIHVTAATASLFRVLGVRPIAGGLFADEDEALPVVVLSESLWRDRLGGAPEGVGRSIALDGVPHTVVGVLPDRVAFPDHRSRAWVPFMVRPPSGNHLSMFHAAARLRAGVDPAQAAAEGTARGRFVADTGLTTRAIFGGDGPVGVEATPLRVALTGEVRRPLLVLLGAVALLVGLVVGNVASLQLARVTVRRRELAIRAALGAGRGALVRQLSAESLLLATAGAAAGLAFAWAAHRFLPVVLPADFPRAPEIAVDGVVVLFAAGVSVLAAAVFGVLPALGVLRSDLAGRLRDDSAPPDDGGRAGGDRRRTLIVAGQVAIACVLLVAASLLGRTAIELRAADRGFDPASVVGARLPMTGPGYSAERRHRIVANVLERLSGMPAIRAAAFTSEHPLAPGGSTSAFDLSTPQGGTVPVQASPRLVTPGYFAALGLPIVAGRAFSDADTAASPRVAVVNETFQRQYLGGHAIGTAVPGGFWGDDGGEATIVGVAGDVKYVGGPAISQPEIFYLLDQAGGRAELPVATLLVRAEGESHRTASFVRQAVREADAGLAVEALMTLDERLRATSLVRPRLYAVVLGTFAVCAVAATGIGLFAVLSYLVTRRTRELGLRMALGAGRTHLVALVLRQGLGVAAAGVAAGVAAALATTPVLATLLYGVAPTDALTYTAVAAGLLGVAAVACVVPAYRAARLDPVRALNGSE